MLGRALSKIPSGKGEGKGSEAELHALRIQTGKIASPPMEDGRGGKVKASPPHTGRRGPPPKIWRRRRPSKGRKHHQGALPRWAPSPRHAHRRASPPMSRKSFINSKVRCYSEIHNQYFVFCSPASSSSQQSSSSGDLRAEMMESETPPNSRPDEAGDTEVSSRRSPDIPKPEASTSAALSPEHLAPTGGR